MVGENETRFSPVSLRFPTVIVIAIEKTRTHAHIATTVTVVVDGTTVMEYRTYFFLPSIWLRQHLLGPDRRFHGERKDQVDNKDNKRNLECGFIDDLRVFLDGLHVGKRDDSGDEGCDG
jgi:hypothetical protein